MRAGCREPGRPRRIASAPRSTGSRPWPRGPERYGSSWVRDLADAVGHPRVPDWDSDSEPETEPTPGRRTGSSRKPAGRQPRLWRRPASRCRRAWPADRRCALAARATDFLDHEGFSTASRTKSFRIMKARIPVRIYDWNWVADEVSGSQRQA